MSQCYVSFYLLIGEILPNKRIILIRKTYLGNQIERRVSFERLNHQFTLIFNLVFTFYDILSVKCDAYNLDTVIKL